MAEYEELFIGIKVEKSELVALRKQINQLDKEIMKLKEKKGKIEVELGMDDADKLKLEKDLAEVDKQLDAFEKEKKILVTARTEEAKKEFVEINQMLQEIAKERNIDISVITNALDADLTEVESKVDEVIQDKDMKVTATVEVEAEVANKQVQDIDKAMRELDDRKAEISVQLKQGADMALETELMGIEHRLAKLTKDREIAIKWDAKQLEPPKKAMDELAEGAEATREAITDGLPEALEETGEAAEGMAGSMEEASKILGEELPKKLSEAKQLLASIAKEAKERVRIAQESLDVAKDEYNSLEKNSAALSKTEAGKKRLSDAVDNLAKAQRDLDVAQKQAAISAQTLAAAHDKLKPVEQGLKRLLSMYGGPWGLAMLAASAGVGALMNAHKKGEKAAEEYGKRMNSISEYYNKIAHEAANATNWTENLTEEQIKGLERHRKKLAEEIESTLAELEKLAQWKQKEFTEGGQDVEIGIKFKTKEGLDAAKEIEALIKNFDYTKDSAEGLRLQIEEVLTRVENLAKTGGPKGLSDDLKTIQSRATFLYGIMEKLIPLIKDFSTTGTALNEEEHTQRQIDREYARSKEARIKALDKTIAATEKHIASLEAEGKATDKAKVALESYNKQLTDLQKTPEPKASRGSAKSDPLADAQKAIAERQELYEADKWVAEQTIADEKKRRARLLQIDKDYFAEYEKLLDKSYTEQAKKGKELSDVQIAELIRVQDMRKQLATDNSAIEALEKEYAAKQQIADQTIADAKQLEAVTLALQTSLAEKKKEVLTTIAMTERESFGSMSEATKQALQGIETDLTSLKEKSKEAAKDMAKEFNEALQEIGQHLNSLASSMGGFLDSFYDARIQSMDKAHERELRMIDNRLQAELAMYEEQLEAFEDLDERRADAQREHEERLAEFNEKIQDHMTEEQWRATQEQIDAEEERYNEQMLILDDEALQRDEIMIQQEMAEAEALARKELMEKEYAIRRAKMERKQAEVNKATAIFQALISNGMAISRAFAEHMYPFSAVVAGIVGTATLAQVAAIAARPLPSIPSFKDGGIVGKANIQHFKHLPQPDNSQDKTLIWAQEGEMVVPKNFFENMYIDQYATTAPIANAIMSRIEGAGGRSIYQTSSEPSTVTNNTGHTMNLNVHPNGGISEAQAKRIANRAIDKLIRG